MKKIDKVITLKNPVTLGERTVSELKFAHAIVRHMIATDGHQKDSFAATLALASSLTGEPESLLGNLEAEDWLEVQTHCSAAYANFVGIDLEQLASQYLERHSSGNPTRSTEEQKTPLTS